MRNREERQRTEAHPLDRRVRVERRVEDQVSGLVHGEPERTSGKKLHSVDRGIPIRLGWLRRRILLGIHRRACKQQKTHDRGGPRATTAEGGTQVATSSVQRSGL